MKLKILMAFDSFKGSLTSAEAGEAAVVGVKDIHPDWDCEVISLGDGGEGTAEVLRQYLGGETVTAKATDPLGRKIDARYVIKDGTAIIEVASASGLTLLSSEEKNPMVATSYGTGELIADALDRGIRDFSVCLGGSAVNDAGIGLLQALGFQFKDNKGYEIGFGGGEMGKIAVIDRSRARTELKESEFRIICDVENPLIGPVGATAVFSSQKGADVEMVRELERNITCFAQLAVETCGRDFTYSKGTGASGGVGFAIMTFLKGKKVSGIEAVLEATDFDSRLKEVDLVFTGEGRIDVQTAMGKAAAGVMKHAKAAGLPVVAFGGRVDKNAVHQLLEAGFNAVLPISDSSLSLEEAMCPETAKSNLRDAVRDYIRNNYN